MQLAHLCAAAPDPDPHPSKASSARPAPSTAHHTQPRPSATHTSGRHPRCKALLLRRCCVRRAQPGAWAWRRGAWRVPRSAGAPPCMAGHLTGHLLHMRPAGPSTRNARRINRNPRLTPRRALTHNKEGFPARQRALRQQSRAHQPVRRSVRPRPYSTMHRPDCLTEQRATTSLTMGCMGCSSVWLERKYATWTPQLGHVPHRWRMRNRRSRRRRRGLWSLEDGALWAATCAKRP